MYLHIHIYEYMYICSSFSPPSKAHYGFLNNLSYFKAMLLVKWVYMLACLRNIISLGNDCFF